MAVMSPERKSGLRRELETIVGAGAVLSDPEELLVYESDGLTLFRALADFIVFPRSAEDVAAIVKDMLAQENHIVAAMGINDGTTDFRAVFKSMGIPDRWILTPGNSATEIRRAFAVFSQSAVRASQGMQLGGFSN